MSFAILWLSCGVLALMCLAGWVYHATHNEDGHLERVRSLAGEVDEPSLAEFVGACVTIVAMGPAALVVVLLVVFA